MPALMHCLVVWLAGCAAGVAARRPTGRFDDDKFGFKRLRYHLQSATNHEHSELHEHLLSHYDRTLYPPPDPNTGRGVNVTLQLWPYDIIYVDTERLALKISGWIDTRWTDRKLRWNPAEFSNITETFIRRDRLWLPRIGLFYSKSLEPPELKECEFCPVRVTHEGDILRGYYIVYSIPCTMNAELFPFDAHRCTMMLANWHTDDRYMDLHPKQKEIDLSTFLKSMEWDLLRMTVNRSRDEYNFGFFPVLQYDVFISRKPGYFISSQIAPTAIITLITVFSFHAPNMASGMHVEKTEMGMTAVLAMGTLQLAVGHLQPKVSYSVPVLAVYHMMMVTLMGLCILSSSIVIAVERFGDRGQPLTGWIRRMTLLPAQCSSESDGEHEPQQQQQEHAAAATAWNMPRDEDPNYHALLQTHTKRQKKYKRKKARSRYRKAREEADETTALVSPESEEHEPLPVEELDNYNNVRPRLATHYSVVGDASFPTRLIEQEMSAALQSLCRHLHKQLIKKEKQKLKARHRLEWMKAADRIEFIMLLVFLLTCGWCTFSFFMPSIFKVKLDNVSMQ